MPEYDFRQARCDTHISRKWMKTKIVVLTTKLRYLFVV